jgi:hypothetical protein
MRFLKMPHTQYAAAYEGMAEDMVEEKRSRRTITSSGL